jgi:hypothetical protein
MFSFLIQNDKNIRTRHPAGKKKAPPERGGRGDMLLQRIEEVKALKALLEENHLHRAAALRTAVECVYGMKEEFFRRGYSKQEADETKDKAWEEAEERFIQEYPS